MIAWKYIDKTAATIAALRDYSTMKIIIDYTPDEIKTTQEKMASPRSAELTGLPSAHNPLAGQARLAAQMDKLDILQVRYAQAADYMAWFEPAWSSLNDTERMILTEFYMADNQKSGATYRVMDKLNYSESHVERLRSRTLCHLCTLLYG